MRLDALRSRGLVSDRVAQTTGADDLGSLQRDPALSQYLGSTSNDGKRLVTDDGGVQRGNVGAVRHDHINAARHQRPKAAGFANPVKDYGPDSAVTHGHIDSKANQRADREARFRGNSAVSVHPVVACASAVRS